MCIVFDCDGIILESVDAKNAAFGRICDEIDPAHTGAFFRNGPRPWGKTLLN